MYRVFCDGYPLYDYRIPAKYPISDARPELELNKTGSFPFSIYPEHPHIGAIRKMRSIVTIYQGDYLLFRGRVLNTEEGFYNEMQVTCEGELAFLLDSSIAPEGTKESPIKKTPKQYLTDIITKHNERMGTSTWKKFGVGVVDLGEDSDGNKIAEQEADFYAEDYKPAWDLINDNLINVYAGYLWVTDGADEEGNAIRVINYYADLNFPSNQTIELGKNLLDVKKTTKGEEITTAIIPIGGSGDSKTTITDLNDGEVGRIDFEGEEAILYKKGDYIYCDKAVEKYGWIFQAATYSDISAAEELQNEAIKDLKSKAVMMSAIELTAADLAGVKKVDPFRLGVKIVAKSKPHDLETLDAESGFLVKKLSLDILNPSNNKLTINDTFLTYTQEAERVLKGQAEIVGRVNKVANHVAGYVSSDTLNAAIAKVEEENSTAIEQSSTAILQEVAQNYYLKDDAETLIQSIETQFTQTNEAFEFQFNEYSQNVNAQFEDISKYIRFVDGDIILGENGNELMLRIENDRISFLQAGVEVAFYSNKQLTVTDGSFLNSLRIGKFAFIPRANGNLSLVKVG